MRNATQGAIDVLSTHGQPMSVFRECRLTGNFFGYGGAYLCEASRRGYRPANWKPTRSASSRETFAITPNRQREAVRPLQTQKKAQYSMSPSCWSNHGEARIVFDSWVAVHEPYLSDFSRAIHRSLAQALPIQAERTMSSKHMPIQTRPQRNSRVYTTDGAIEPLVVFMDSNPWCIDDGDRRGVRQGIRSPGYRRHWAYIFAILVAVLILAWTSED